MTARKRPAPTTPEEQAHIDDCIRAIFGDVVDRDAGDARRARAWINTPPSDAETRAAEEEWQARPDSQADRERWIETRARELHRNGLVKSYKDWIAFVREHARRDPGYALTGPVLGAAREETKDSNLSPWHQQAARKFLDTASDGDELARSALGDASGVDRLARLLQPWAAKAWRIVTDVVTGGDPEQWRVVRHQATRATETSCGPVHWADAEFAVLLRTIGPPGEKAADAVLRLGAARLAQLDLPDPFPWLGDRAQRDEWWDRIEKTGADELLDEVGLGAACWELWLHEDSHPRIYDYLAWALWGVLRPQLEREARLIAPALPVWMAHSLTAAPRAESIIADRGAIVFADRNWRYTAPPAALADVAHGALDENARRAAATVAAYLAIAAWRQLRAGVERFDYVPIPAGRNALREIFGAELTAADLDAALEWLQGFHVGGWPCVAGVYAEKIQPPGGGRPATARVVHVGLPLAPHSIERVYLQAGVTLPSELRWYSPVLPPANAPLVGDHRTRERQRAAFALGLGAVLIERREEYADRGGGRLSDLRRPLARLGIYHRSHKSLVDDVLGAWLTEPSRPLLPELPTAPVLIETTAGGGIYRLGPDYGDAHQMILGAAGLSGAGRRRNEHRRKKRE